MFFLLRSNDLKVCLSFSKLTKEEALGQGIQTTCKVRGEISVGLKRKISDPSVAWY